MQFNPTNYASPMRFNAPGEATPENKISKSGGDTRTQDHTQFSESVDSGANIRSFSSKSFFEPSAKSQLSYKCPPNHERFSSDLKGTASLPAITITPPPDTQEEANKEPQASLTAANQASQPEIIYTPKYTKLLEDLQLDETPKVEADYTLPSYQTTGILKRFENSSGKQGPSGSSSISDSLVSKNSNPKSIFPETLQYQYKNESDDVKESSQPKPKLMMIANTGSSSPLGNQSQRDGMFGAAKQQIQSTSETSPKLEKKDFGVRSPPQKSSILDKFSREKLSKGEIIEEPSDESMKKLESTPPKAYLQSKDRENEYEHFRETPGTGFQKKAGGIEKLSLGTLQFTSALPSSVGQTAMFPNQLAKLPDSFVEEGEEPVFDIKNYSSENSSNAHRNKVEQSKSSFVLEEAMLKFAPIEDRNPRFGYQPENGEDEYFSFAGVRARWLNDTDFHSSQLSKETGPVHKINLKDSIGGRSANEFEPFFDIPRILMGIEVLRLQEVAASQKSAFESQQASNQHVQQLQERNKELQEELAKIKRDIVDQNKNSIEILKQKMKDLNEGEYQKNKISSLESEISSLKSELVASKHTNSSYIQELEWRIKTKQTESDNRDQLNRKLEEKLKQVESDLLTAKQRQTTPIQDETPLKKTVDSLTSSMQTFFEGVSRQGQKTGDTNLSVSSQQIVRLLQGVKNTPSEIWRSGGGDQSLAILNSNLQNLLSIIENSRQEDQLSFRKKTSYEESGSSGSPTKMVQSNSSTSLSPRSSYISNQNSVLVQEKIEMIDGKPMKVKYIRREPIVKSREVSVETKPPVILSGSKFQSDTASTARPVSPFGTNNPSMTNSTTNAFSIGVTQKLIEENNRMAEEFLKVKSQNKSLKDQINSLMTKYETNSYSHYQGGSSPGPSTVTY